MAVTVDVALECHAQLAEGPLWDATNQRLLWVDIIGNAVHAFDPETGVDTSVNVGENVGTVVLRRKGGLAVALRSGFALLDYTTSKLTRLIDPESNKPENRFNDGKSDPCGRFIAGTMDDVSPESKRHGHGKLYALDKDCNVRELINNVTISNGLCWHAISHEAAIFYYIDTPTREIVSFDYDNVTGDLSNRRVAVTVPSGSFPDGMTIDTDGNLWVAHWNGSKITQYNPYTGRTLQSIPIPARQVTSVAFGGKRLDEIYVTSARVGLDENELASEHYAGCIFKVTGHGAQGLPADTFDL